ncbi:hypothetical protein [Sphingomonas sp. ID0503]|uniref:hypothetical protein n=1 Tax=Sphingomonas sp. ID0503 TaxID=3399691 RepID=UPI003AFAFAC7
MQEAITLKARILQRRDAPGAGAAFIESKMPVIEQKEPFLQQLLQLYGEAGDKRGVDDTYLRLYRLHPDNPDYQFQYGRVMLNRGREGEAVGMFKRLRTAHGSSVPVNLAIVRAIAAAKGNAAASADIRAAAPGATDAVRQAYAGFLLDAGDAAGARAMLRSLADAAPNLSNSDGQAVLAAAELAVGDRAAARRRADAVLAVDSVNRRALTARINIALADRDFEKALGLARLLVSAYREDAAARILLARVHKLRREPVLEESVFRSAAQELKDSVPVMIAFTDYLTARGDIDAAADAAQDFTLANPRIRTGWVRQLELCTKAEDDVCAARARRRLAADAGARAAAASRQRVAAL